MMKKTKTIYKTYAAWDFDREVRDLEEHSRNGWHLIKGGLFHCKFTFDDTVRYRYALDYHPHIEDPARYRETFAEQGWEFVNSTFNGWHYFRKVYDPALPEGEYLIYTDTASREEMAGRWKKFAGILGGIELVLGVVMLILNFWEPAVYSICMAFGAVLLGGVLVLSRKWIGKPDRRRAPIQMMIPVALLFAIALIYGGFRLDGFNSQTEYLVPEDDSPWEIDFDVKLPDFYTFDVEVKAQTAVSVSIVKAAAKEDSAPVRPYTAEGTQIKGSVRMFLMPGTYTISTQYLPGAKPGQSGKFEYTLF